MSRVFSAFPLPPGLTNGQTRAAHGRLNAALFVAARTPEEFGRACGDPQSRLRAAVSGHSQIVGVEFPAADHALITSIARIEEENDGLHLPWDDSPVRSVDGVEGQSIDIPRVFGEFCPEFEIVESRVLLPDMTPFEIGGMSMWTPTAGTQCKTTSGRRCCECRDPGGSGAPERRPLLDASGARPSCSRRPPTALGE